MKTNRVCKLQATLLAVILGTLFILVFRVPLLNAQTETWAYLEVKSDNKYPQGWRLFTDTRLLDYNSPDVFYSVNGSPSYPLFQATNTSGLYTDVWQADVTNQIGGVPMDYEGSTFTWTVKEDQTTVLHATATSTGIRRVPFSQNITITGPFDYPTVSWSNPDPNVDKFRIRVWDANALLWETNYINAVTDTNYIYTYTFVPSVGQIFNGFEPGKQYYIGVLAQDTGEYGRINFTPDSDIPYVWGWPTNYLILTNRSTVRIPYPSSYITTASMIEDLANYVISLNIRHGISNSLDAKLNAAISAIDDLNESNDAAAINSLNAFINAVQAQSGKAIPYGEAIDLIATAQLIINQLSQ